MHHIDLDIAFIRNILPEKEFYRKEKEGVRERCKPEQSVHHQLGEDSSATELGTIITTRSAVKQSSTSCTLFLSFLSFIYFILTS